MYRAIEDKYGRIGKIEITENGKVIYSSSPENGLDFKFDVEYTYNDQRGILAQASVGVLGLQGETIRKLIEYGPAEVAMKKNRIITVYAGYKSDPNVLTERLFILPIATASVTQPPEMWLNVYSWNDAQIMLEDQSESQNEKDDRTENEKRLDEIQRQMETLDKEHDPQFLKWHATLICHALNLQLKWEVSEEDTEKIPRMDWPTMPIRISIPQFVKYWNDLGWVKADLEMKYANIFDRNFKVRGVPKVLHLSLNSEYVFNKDLERQQHEYDKKTAIADGRVISKETGMIGLPEFQPLEGQITITVKTLLRRDIKVDDFIKVKSSIIDTVEGMYFRVSKIKYSGHLRGNEWYSIFTAIREYRPEKKSIPNSEEPSLTLEGK